MQHSCHDSFLQRLSKQVLRISSLLLLLKSATGILAILSQKKTAAISCLTACCLKYLNWAAQSGCDMTWMMTLDNSNWCSGRSVVNLTMQNILIILYYIVLGTISNYITWWGWGKLNLFEISTPMFCTSKCIFFIYNRTNAGLALTTSFIPRYCGLTSLWTLYRCLCFMVTCVSMVQTGCTKPWFSFIWTSLNKDILFKHSCNLPNVWCYHLLLSMHFQLLVSWKKEWASSHTPRFNIAVECCISEWQFQTLVTGNRTKKGYKLLLKKIKSAFPVQMHIYTLCPS